MNGALMELRSPVSVAPCYMTKLYAETQPSGRTGAVPSKALPGADRGGRESAPLLQTVTHQKGQTVLIGPILVWRETR